MPRRPLSYSSVRGAFPLLFALLALTLDQVVKLYCETTFLHSSFPTARHVPSALLFSLGIPPLQVRLGGALPQAVTSSWLAIELTHVTNRGITFGLLETAHPIVPLAAFYGTTLLGIVAGAVVLWRAKPELCLRRAGAVLLITGVLANLLDRLRIGYVIDWLVIGWRLSAWQVELPAFNFGDAYIVMGVLLLAVGLIRNRLRTRPIPIAVAAP